MSIKTIFESAEAFTAYATIEAGMYMMGLILENQPKRSAVEMAIDVATGYDDVLTSKMAAQMVPVLEDIIGAKKFIGMPTEADEKLLELNKHFITHAQK